jgi:CubicO group peptidase (beta-lactamase class C family)
MGGSGSTIPSPGTCRHPTSPRPPRWLRTDHITIRHLLTHTAGLYDYAMDPHRPIIFAIPRTAGRASRWTGGRVGRSQRPWGGLHYTDTGYILLGAIIERLNGKDWPSRIVRCSLRRVRPAFHGWRRSS